MDLFGNPNPSSVGINASTPYDPNANYSLPAIPDQNVTAAPFPTDAGYSTSSYGPSSGYTAPSGYSATNYPSTSYGQNQLNDLGTSSFGSSLSPSPSLPNYASNQGALGANLGGYSGATSTGVQDAAIQAALAASTGGGGGGASGGGSSSIPWNLIFDPSATQTQLAQQQQYLSYMLSNYLPWYQQQMATMDQLQQNLAQAQMTGNYQGVQTLQSQLQNAQINLQNQQANMQAAIAQAQMTGVTPGSGTPTLEAQNLQNQFAATGGNQLLTARGQDVQAQQTQAALAQSPLVAWYTARGLPPPQSALLQPLPTYNAPNYSWNFQQSAPPVPYLPQNYSGGGSTPVGTTTSSAPSTTYPAPTGIPSGTPGNGSLIPAPSLGGNAQSTMMYA